MIDTYYPVGNREFQRLLRDGIFAECVVMDTMNELMSPHDVGSTETDWWVDDEVSDKAPYDLLVQYESDLLSSVEVKQANNDGRYTDWNTGNMTFFAECIQTGTNTYPEYLVFPPDIMVYYNKAANDCYFYNGKRFAAAVKLRFDDRFPIARGTAEGIKFDCMSKDFGFLCRVAATNPREHLEKKYLRHINERMANNKKTPNLFKRCDGLEDLK
jgi:hypothetical protein